jgi:protein-tyrosine phosphatase
MGEAAEMIDLHSHILCGLDDGAKSMEESFQMCRMSFQDGIRTVVATPHLLPGIYKNDRSTILSKVVELNNALVHSELRTPDSELSLDILPGADVHFSSDLLQLCENGEVVTVNDNGLFLMVEFDFQGIPYHAGKVLFQMIAKGIIPIITHPERNFEIGQSPKRYYEMIRMGCLGQVTAMSLTGGFGSGVKRIAENLLENRLVHIIATDAHSTDGRPPVLSAGVRAAGKIIGREEAIKMVTEYPEAIIEGRRPNIPDPIPI